VTFLLGAYWKNGFDNLIWGLGRLDDISTWGLNKKEDNST
jgi:hypothetical protein